VVAKKKKINMHTYTVYRMKYNKQTKEKAKKKQKAVGKS